VGGGKDGEKVGEVGGPGAVATPVTPVQGEASVLSPKAAEEEEGRKKGAKRTGGTASIPRYSGVEFIAEDGRRYVSGACVFVCVCVCAAFCAVPYPADAIDDGSMRTQRSSLRLVFKTTAAANPPPPPSTPPPHTHQMYLMATFKGLVPGEQYRFRIAAVNDAGFGAYSVPTFSHSTKCARTWTYLHTHVCMYTSPSAPQNGGAGRIIKQNTPRSPHPQRSEGLATFWNVPQPRRSRSPRA
jgi:hypothetical protein